MEENLPAIIALTIYKVLSLSTGALFGLLGYRLFINNIWGKAGNLETNFKNTRIIIKAGAPGTFFALFGAIIIAVTLIQGLSIPFKQNIDKPALPIIDKE